MWGNLDDVITGQGPAGLKREGVGGGAPHDHFIRTADLSTNKGDSTYRSLGQESIRAGERGYHQQFKHQCQENQYAPNKSRKGVNFHALDRGGAEAKKVEAWSQPGSIVTVGKNVN